MGWAEIVQHAAIAKAWENCIQVMFPNDAKELIDEANRRAIYRGGSVPDRLAEIYADAIEFGPREAMN